MSAFRYRQGRAAPGPWNIAHTPGQSSPAVVSRSGSGGRSSSSAWRCRLTTRRSLTTAQHTLSALGRQDNRAGRPPTPAARVDLTDLTPAYKRYRQATLLIRDHALVSGDSVCFVAGDTTGGAPPAAVLRTDGHVAIDVQVDHDGDGHPSSSSASGSTWCRMLASRLRAVVPSVIVAGERFAVTVLAEDSTLQPGCWLDGRFRHARGSELARGAFPPAGSDSAGTLRLEGLRMMKPSSGVVRLDVQLPRSE